VQHGREQEKIVAADESDVNLWIACDQLLEVERRVQASKPSTEHDDARWHASNLGRLMSHRPGGYTLSI
jgi:hypothetical protein